MQDTGEETRRKLKLTLTETSPRIESHTMTSKRKNSQDILTRVGNPPPGKLPRCRQRVANASSLRSWRVNIHTTSGTLQVGREKDKEEDRTHQDKLAHRSKILERENEDVDDLQPYCADIRVQRPWHVETLVVPTVYL